MAAPFGRRGEVWCIFDSESDLLDYLEPVFPCLFKWRDDRRVRSHRQLLQVPSFFDQPHKPTKMAGDSFKLFTSIRYDRKLLDTPSCSLQHAGWNSNNKSSLYMLDLHRDRMLRAASFWGWTAVVDVLSGDGGLERISNYVHGIVSAAGTQDIPQRIKISLTREAFFSHETYPVTQAELSNLFPARIPPPTVISAQVLEGDPSRGPFCQVVIDSVQTIRSEFTHFKTSKRNIYNLARQRAKIATADNKEILMVNAEGGLIMEGSVTTPYFWRNGRWVTPPVSQGYDRRIGSGGQDGTSRRWALER